MIVTRISRCIHEWAGWCPNSPGRGHLQIQQDRMSNRSGLPEPRSPRAERTTNAERYPVPGWFVSVSIIILFGTLFFGGSIYWPVLVLATLIAGLAYWYITVVRREA